MGLDLSTVMASLAIGTVADALVGDAASSAAAAVGRTTAQAIRRRLADGRMPTELPVARELQRASHSALRTASGVLLTRLVADLSPDVGFGDLLLASFRRGRSPCSGLSRSNFTPEARWCRALEQHLRSSAALDDFDDATLLDQKDLGAMAADAPDEHVREAFDRAYGVWLRALDLPGVPPARLGPYLREGWPAGEPGSRMTLYDAYLVSFVDLLKRDERVRAVYEAVTGAEQRELLRNMPSVVEMSVSSMLDDRLGTASALLERVLEEERARAVVAASAVRRYLDWVVRTHSFIELPLPVGEPSLRRHEIHVTLPLRLTHERGTDVAEGDESATEEYERRQRSRFRSSRFVDRVPLQQSTVDRPCTLAERLGTEPAGRVVLVGDPGSGKSTTLGAVAYACALTAEPERVVHAAVHPTSGPDADPQAVAAATGWLGDGSGLRNGAVPIVVRCRDHEPGDLLAPLDAVIAAQLRRTTLRTQDEIDVLADVLYTALLDGDAILLVDGLDEIASRGARVEFAERLAHLASEEPAVPMLITSRVSGFNAVARTMDAFDHLNVAPLGPEDKRAYISRWRALAADEPDLDPSDFDELARRVVDERSVAAICENILVLSLITHMHVITVVDADARWPGNRRDIYRMATRLMVERQRSGAVPPLAWEEIEPHLQHLAYEMRASGDQSWPQDRIVASLAAYRSSPRSAGDDASLGRRDPRLWLAEVVERTNLLTDAGVVTSDPLHQRRRFQFFHQSFQEYFAAQALHDGRATGVAGDAVDVVRARVREAEPVPRVFEVWNRTLDEHVVADDWEEVVRHWIEELDAAAPDDSTAVDDAVLMMLPRPGTSRPKGRALAVFALHCVANLQGCRPATVDAVCDAVIDVLGDADGLQDVRHTQLDDALHAVATSRWADRLRARMLDRYDAVVDPTVRLRIGRTAAAVLTHGIDRNHPDEIAAAVGDAVADVLDGSPAATTPRTYLRLMAVAYVARVRELAEQPPVEDTGGPPGSPLPDKLWRLCRAIPLRGVGRATRRRLVDHLIAAVAAADRASVTAAWALRWVIGPHLRIADVGALTAEHRAQVRRLLANGACDPHSQSVLAELLAMPTDDSRRYELDWILAYAHLADGDLRRSLLPHPSSARDDADRSMLARMVVRPLPIREAGAVALAAGRAGLRTRELIAPLVRLLRHGRPDADTRDEAIVLLSQIPDMAAAGALHSLSVDPPPDIDVTFWSERMLLAIVGSGDVDVIAATTKRVDGRMELQALAIALLDGGDVRARAAFNELRTSADTDRRAAARWAMSQHGAWHERRFGVSPN